MKKIILERRSVRKFTDDYVTDEQLKELLEAARFAPSWANTQSSYFIAIRNKELIKELVEKCYPKNPATNCSLGTSLLIVACYEKGKSGYYKDFDFNSVGTWGMFDLGLACQNIMLRAHEMGLGTVVVGAYDFENAKSILNLEEKYEIAGILPIGKRVEGEIPVPKRRDLKDMFRILD
ncbi:MAG: nitroreductase family protein [Fusobacteriaceae bacterium]|nr:nitroreductase family protein [Fusobacteriaceae bacterium]MBN2837209.1 nitroreductase family protein [Fusobacteriaceae bacterium]